MILDEFGKQLEEDQLDFTLGYIAEGDRLKPEAVPPDDVTKFAYEDGDYEPYREFRYYSEAEQKFRRIAALKAKLAETDYIAVKLMEGSATREEYAALISQRQSWRDEINELEGNT